MVSKKPIVNGNLKPCPFCGSKPEYVHNPDMWDEIICPDCGTYWQDINPVTGWNKRPAENSLRAQLTAAIAGGEYTTEMNKLLSNQLAEVRAQLTTIKAALREIEILCNSAPHGHRSEIEKIARKALADNQI